MALLESWLHAPQENCDTITLRSCTMLMGILSFWLLSQIYEELHPDKKGAYAKALVSQPVNSPRLANWILSGAW